MEKFYTVLEVQVNNGVKSTIPLIYEDENIAYNKYYTVLAAASVSQIEYHSCHIIRSDGLCIESKVYDRRVEPQNEE